MADYLTLNVNPSFDMDIFAVLLADRYLSRGYAVDVDRSNGTYSLSFSKDTGAMHTLLGLNQGIKATITQVSGDTVSISFTRAQWKSKIICCTLGWPLCMIPFITAIIGTAKQLSLPKKIGYDASSIAALL